MSFRDFITNRLFRKRLAIENLEFENIRPPANPSRKYIDKLVSRLLTDRHAEAAHRELKLIGAASAPSLLAALHDSQYHAEVKRSVMVDQPFDMVMSLLAPYCPDELIAAAQLFVK